MPRSLNLLWNKVNIYSYHVSEILCTSRVKKIYLWFNILRNFYGCFHHVCLMDSDSSSVWHYVCLNNWGQPYIARRRVKVTTYRQEIQKFSVHVEMYCFGYLMSKHSKRMQYSPIQSLKVNFHRCISQRLCNVLFTTVSHKCQWNTFSVTNHFTLIFFLLLSMIPFLA